MKSDPLQQTYEWVPQLRQPEVLPMFLIPSEAKSIFKMYQCWHLWAAHKSLVDILKKKKKKRPVGHTNIKSVSPPSTKTEPERKHSTYYLLLLGLRPKYKPTYH